MKVEIRNAQFDPCQEVLIYQENNLSPGKFGAATIFIGTMRDFNEGDAVTAMNLEYYPEMTQQHLEQIAKEAMEKFDILDLFVLHRVGQIFPGNPIVCVAVWSEHRAAAYEANRFIMEDLKVKAPFWKQETLEKNTSGRTMRWVEKNTQN